MPLAVFPKGFFDALVTRQMRLEEWLDLAATLEVDGVELYPDFLPRLDDGYLGELRKRLGDRGLEMPMLCHSPDFTQPEREARRAEVQRTERMIALTAALGGRFCRVLSGQRRPGLGEEALDWVIDCLTALLPIAEEHGVVLTLENHYKEGQWPYPEFAQSRSRFLALLESVPSPWLQVQYDPSNALVAGDDPYHLLDEVIGRVATVHASDRFLEGGTVEDLRRLDRDPTHGYAPLLRHGVIGEGLIDFDRIFSTLAARRFDGWISIEDGEGETVADGMRNLRASVAFLRERMGRWFDDDIASPAPSPNGPTSHA